MAPAIRLAADGFVLTSEEAGSLHDKILTGFPASKHIFQRDGNFYKTGETFSQPELAATLRHIVADPSDFYHGAMAKQIADAVQARAAASSPPKTWPATPSKEREPIIGTYRGYTIVSAPPPSSGGVALIEMLNILDGYNLRPLGDRTAPEMHLIIEAFRRAYMDRTNYLGDPGLRQDPHRRSSSAKITATPGAPPSTPITPAPPPRSNAPPDSCPPRPPWPMFGRKRPTPRTTPSSTRRATRSLSRLPSTAAMAPASPCLVSAFSSTTRWTTSPRSKACRTCSD